MSSTDTNPSAREQLGEITAPLVMVTASVIFTWLMLQLDRMHPLAVLIIFIGACTATVMKQRWFTYLMLAFLLFVWSTNWSGLNIRMPGDVLYIFYLLGYALTSLRFSDMKFQFRLTDTKPEQQQKPVADDSEIFQSIRPLTAGWSWIPVALLTALLVLAFIPHSPSAEDRFRITPEGFRAISILWFTAFFWFVGCGVLGFLTLREKDAGRARVYARSLYCRQIAKEMRGIEKRRIKTIKKKNR